MFRVNWICNCCRKTSAFIQNQSTEDSITRVDLTRNNLETSKINVSEPDVEDFLQKRIENPNAVFTVEQSLDILFWCIEKGIEKVHTGQGKEVVVFLGNTGSGKSTTVNFLHGCQLCYVQEHPDHSSPFFSKSLDVAINDERGPCKPATKIGHGKTSQTLFPNFITHSDIDLISCDFPGFQDNRGPEISIAGAVTMATILNSCSGVKFVICIRYSSLFSERLRGLNTKMKLLEQLFQSKSWQEDFSASILFAITCAPSSALSTVKKILQLFFQKESTETNLLGDCKFNVVLVCPYEEDVILGEKTGPFYVPPADFSREKFLSQIRNLKYISGHTFDPPLSPNDLQLFISMQQRIEAFISTCLTEHNFSATEIAVKRFKQLPESILRSELIDFIFQNSIYSPIKSCLFDLKQKFYLFCLPGQHFDRLKAQTMLEAIRAFVEVFGDASVDISTLELHLEECCELNRDRQGEEPVIVAQLKLRSLISQDVQNTIELEQMTEKFNTCMAEVEVLINGLGDSTAQKRHRLELGETKAMFDAKRAKYMSMKDRSICKSNIATIKAERRSETEGQEEKLKEVHTLLGADFQQQSCQNDGNSEDSLINKLVQDSYASLSFQERLQLFQHCITQGTLQGQAAKNQDVYVFIGNSGAGKSTIVNMLCGCTMVRDNAEPPRIRVLSIAEGGVKDEVTAVGHGRMSSTLFVNLIPSEYAGDNIIFCDCPGFNENRGLELSIGNAVSLKIALNVARRIKFVVLVSYHSLDADRGGSLTSVQNSFQQLFGNSDLLLECSKSILVGITHAPDNIDDRTLQYFLHQLADDAFFSLVFGNALVIDPVMPGSRMEILAKLDELEWQTNGHSFKISLSPDDESDIVALLSGLLNEVHSKMNQRDFPGALQGLVQFSSALSILEAKMSKFVMSMLEKSILSSIEPFLDDITNCYLSEDFEQSKQLFDDLSKILKCAGSKTFGNQMQYHESQMQEAQCRRFYEKSKQRTQEAVLKFMDGVTNQSILGLVQFFLSTNGEEWNNNKNWLKSEDYRNWKGVEVDGKGSVVGLSLPANNLMGILQEDIFVKLPDLVNIDLSGNNLYGELPVSLIRLPNLKTLVLDMNSDLCGPIPDLPKTTLSCENTAIGHHVQVSLEYPSFPFWVCCRKAILQMECIVPHEVALNQHGVLVQLVSTSHHNRFLHWHPRGTSGFDRGVVIDRAHIMFVSHRWLCLNFPDDDQHSKLNQIKNVLRLKKFHKVKYVWMDYLCVPQSSEHTEQQLRAINSLPYYVRCCSVLVTLVGEEGEARLVVYANRGWCRLERFAAFTPVLSAEGESVQVQLFVHNKDTHELEACQYMHTTEAEANPLNGIFWAEQDKNKIAPSLIGMCVTIIEHSTDSSLKQIAESIIFKPELKELVAELYPEILKIGMNVTDGLELWLDVMATETIELDPMNSSSVMQWRSRSGCLVQRTLETEFPGSCPVFDQSQPNSIEFDYNKTLTINPALEHVQTLISVHKFKDSTRGTDGSPRAQFYIICGTEQGPFHGAGGNTPGTCITSGDGAWEGAGGKPFYDGEIRIGGIAQQVKNTAVWKDTFKVATVTCTDKVPADTCNWGSRGVDRIGRDRMFHEFAGFLSELLVFNRQLSAMEIASIEDYLALKYQL